MKFLALYFTIAVVAIQLAVCSKELDNLVATTKKCIKDSELTEDAIQKFFKDGPKPEAATPQIKCLMKCIMEETDQLKNGALDVDAALKYWSTIPELQKDNEIIKAAYESCQSEKGDDDCDTAFKISMCLHKQEGVADLKL